MAAGKTSVLITAGAGRLGLVLAREALALGLDVVLHYRSSAADARQWLRRTPAMRRRVHLLQADLRACSAADLVGQALAVSPRLVGLVNNASVFSTGDLADQEHLRSTIETNAIVPAALAEAFRSQAGAGWIVNITDAHVRPLNRNFQNYRISKLLLAELTRQQAFLYAPRIRVNAIAPGAMLRASGTSARAFAGLARLIPLRRTGDLASLREAFAYLIRNEYVTGQTLYVDGGWHLAD